MLEPVAYLEGGDMGVKTPPIGRLYYVVVVNLVLVLFILCVL